MEGRKRGIVRTSNSGVRRDYAYRQLADSAKRPPWKRRAEAFQNALTLQTRRYRQLMAIRAAGTQPMFPSFAAIVPPPHNRPRPNTADATLPGTTRVQQDAYSRPHKPISMWNGLMGLGSAFSMG